jgi:hypothetical protein
MLAVGAVVGVFGGSGVVDVVVRDSQAMIATVVIAASIMGVGKASIGLRKFFTMSPVDCNKGFFDNVLQYPTWIDHQADDFHWSVGDAFQLSACVYQPTATLNWLFHSWVCLSISLVPRNTMPVSAIS